MAHRFWRFSLLILIFVGLYSCKKQKDCNTAPDCEAIGKYRVTVSHFFSSPIPGDSIYEFDSILGRTTVFISESADSTLLFIDDSILDQQFVVTYDLSFSTPNSVYYGAWYSSHLTVFNADSLYAFSGGISTPQSEGYTWVGVKIH